MADDIKIINCHIHLFTKNHIPAKYYGYLRFATSIFKNKFLTRLLKGILELLEDWGVSGRLAGYADRIPRLRIFTMIMDKDSQEEVFQRIRSYYPDNTRFVVLPMDFSRMGYGESKKGTRDQHDRLAELRDRVNAEVPDRIIPFTHFDPRNDDALELTQKYVLEHGFKGVKIYPPMGYNPSDPILDGIYRFCDEHVNGLPVMTHCSGALIRSARYARALQRAEAARFCDPNNYKPVLNKYRNLRLCLGHFGGNNAWEAYLNEPDMVYNNPDPERPDSLFLPPILEMLRSGEYPNLFVDIAYVIFSNMDYARILKVFLQDPGIRSQVLFGSDYYMVEIEEKTEKEVSMILRETLEEDLYREIAERNPLRYLYGEDAPV